MANFGKGKKNTAVKRAIVTPDKHFPYEDKPAIKVLCKAIDMVKQLMMK